MEPPTKQERAKRRRSPPSLFAGPLWLVGVDRLSRFARAGSANKNVNNNVGLH